MIGAFKSLYIPNKIDELKQIESIYPKNQLNHLIIDKLKKSHSYRIISN